MVSFYNLGDWKVYLDQGLNEAVKKDKEEGKSLNTSDIIIE